MSRFLVFSMGVTISLATLSIAKGSVPLHSRVTDDTAIYQNLSEIRAQREKKPDFDSDITQLSQMESRYQERLPSLASHPRLVGPMSRISAQNYRYVGTKSRTQRAQKPIRQ